MGLDLNRFRGKRNDEWVDWLADDPVPATIRTRMREQAVRRANTPVSRAPQPQPSTTQTPTTESQQNPNKQHSISINLALPKFKKPNLTLIKSKLQKLPYQDKRFVGGAIVVGVLVVGVSTLALWPDGKKDTPEVLSQNTQTADFDYSLPKGDASALDGSVRYDGERKVVNYKDSIGGVEITISQQPLPAGFETDTDNKVKKLAEDFSATKALTTANPTAYLGTSVRGPQTVIFSKKKLLVFIQSVQEIDDHDWAEYITNLQ